MHGSHNLFCTTCCQESSEREPRFCRYNLIILRWPSWEQNCSLADQRRLSMTELFGGVKCPLGTLQHRRRSKMLFHAQKGHLWDTRKKAFIHYEELMEMCRGTTMDAQLQAQCVSIWCRGQRSCLALCVAANDKDKQGDLWECGRVCGHHETTKESGLLRNKRRKKELSFTRL